jgi:putative mRNA 3-end processing factor
VHWCTAKGLSARPLDLVGYGDEDDSETSPPAEGLEA